MARQNVHNALENLKKDSLLLRRAFNTTNKWIKKINNYLFPDIIAIRLNSDQTDALQRMTFDSDRYLEKKEELNKKLASFQYLPDWDPLNDIRFDTAYEYEDIIFLSDAIINRVEQDPHFKRYCSNVLRALILYVSKMPNKNTLALAFIYSIVINTKNIADLFIKIGFSSPTERKALEKWHRAPSVGMNKLALCLKPYIIKKFPDNDNIVSFLR